MDKYKPPFVKRVVLKNFKSFKHCDVELGPLTILVGPNGSGKSNFLDALQFVRNALNGTVNDAFMSHRGRNSSCFGGMSQADFSIELTLILPDGTEAFYHLTISDTLGTNPVSKEFCRIGDENSPLAEYCIQEGKVISASFSPYPPASSDRLYLPLASGYTRLRRLYEPLAGMSFYNIIPDEVRKPPEGSGLFILPSNGYGMNILLSNMSKHNPDILDKLTDYLRAFVPMFEKIVPSSLDVSGEKMKKSSLVLYNYLGFVFAGTNSSFALASGNVSDGTLRALGILTALYQCLVRPENSPVPLVAIEEPETALHPAAVAVLMDAMHEASGFTQVIATTQSPELLDHIDLDSDVLLVTDMGDEGTVIAPVDEASRQVVREGLSTPGELLKQSQLSPRNNDPMSVQD